MATGRYKLGPDGAYFDPNDEGPDQASPEQITALKGAQPSPQPSSTPDTYAGPTGAEGPTLQKPAGGSEEGATLPLEDHMYKLQTDSGGGIASPYTPTGPSFQDSMNAWAATPESITDPGGFNRPITPEMSHPWSIASDPTAGNIRQPGEGIQLAGGVLDPTTGLPSSGNTGVAGGVDRGAPQPAAQTGAVPLGFDATKWNDPNKSDPKYDAGHMKASGMTDEAIGAAIQAKYPTYKYMGGDKILGPDGHIYDFDFASKTGAGSPAWTDTGDPNHPTTGTSPTAGSSASGVGSAVSGSPGTGGIAGMFGNGPIPDAIMRLLGRGEAGTENDPNIAAATAAYRGEVERQGRRSRNAMAERAAAEGLNYGGSGSGAFDSSIQSELESEGMKVGQFRANETLQEIAAKRQDVINALQLAQGQEKLGLEQYLAQLNDQLQRAQMAQQNSQYYDNLTYNMGRDAAGLDERMLGYLQ